MYDCKKARTKITILGPRMKEVLLNQGKQIWIKHTMMSLTDYIKKK